jgi:hypothetical protein
VKRLVVVVAALVAVPGCVSLANLCGTCCLSCANGGGPVPDDQQLPEPPSTLTLTSTSKSTPPASASMSY